MQPFPIAARRTRVLAALLIAVEAAGCAQWRPEPGAPGAILAAKRPEKVRVNLGLDSVIVVYRPVVDGDMLRGQDEHAQHAIAIPLAEVRLLETRQAKSGPIILAAVGGAMLIGMIVWLSNWRPLGGH